MRRRQPAQVLKAINAGAVSITPARLHCITAYELETRQLKTFRRVSHVRSCNVAEHIRLSAAGRAGTSAAKKLEPEIRFGPIVPMNGELIPDLLNVRRFQTHDGRS